MSEEAVLTYFEGRGLGEIIRLTLSVAKIPVRYCSKNYLLIELKIHILSRKTARVVRFFELNVFLQFKQNFVHTSEDLQKLIAGRGRQPTFIDILRLLRCSSEM